MKKLIYYASLLLYWTAGSVYAQTPNSDANNYTDPFIAPNFSMKDINGKTWKLYTLLEQGKTVVLDLSATW